jgi:DNA (cytosine-5)-methyltransferase 1
MKYIDLFAGTGAFTIALKDHQCVFANDNCKNSEIIYNANHGEECKLTLGNLEDIKLDDIPPCDIVCSGWPCQPFSLSGKQLGFSDQRSNTFFSLLRVIEYRKPKFFILENVKNLQSHDKGQTFEVIKNSLLGLNYKIKYKILDTNKLTKVPQHRERIYIVGFNASDPIPNEAFDKFTLDFPEIEEQGVIMDYLEHNVDEKYYYNDRYKVYDVIKNGVVKHISTNTVYQYRRYYVRENKSAVCQTLTANMGTGGHNVPLILDDIGIRKLTPRECFNLQGFDSTYVLPSELSDSALYKLAGNAVSVPIVKLIVDRLNS